MPPLCSAVGRKKLNAVASFQKKLLKLQLFCFEAKAESFDHFTGCRFGGGKPVLHTSVTSMKYKSKVLQIC